MEVVYELTYEDMKKVIIESFYLLPKSNKIKDTIKSIVLYISVLYVILSLLPNYSFFNISLFWFVFGLFIYFLLTRSLPFLISRAAIVWKKKELPYQYQIILLDDYLIYKDLQKERNNLKIPWENLKLKKEDEYYFYFYITSLHRTLVLKKQILPSSTISERQYIQFLQEKIN